MNKAERKRFEAVVHDCVVKRGYSIERAEELAAAAIRGGGGLLGLLEPYLDRPMSKTTERIESSRAAYLTQAIKSLGRDASAAAIAREYMELACRSDYGSTGRKRHVLWLKNFFTFAVERRHFDPAQFHLHDDVVFELKFGENATATRKPINRPTISTPLKCKYFSQLLDYWEKEDPKRWLLIGLVGLYGLRLAEVACINYCEETEMMFLSEPKGFDKLPKEDMVGSNINQRCRFPALDIPGREGLGLRMLHLYASGLGSLPTPVTKAIHLAGMECRNDYQSIGQKVSESIKRNAFWKVLTAELSGVTPYSLRHSYAWRAHNVYRRDFSQAHFYMRHTAATHYKHYASFMDQRTANEAYEKSVKVDQYLGKI